MYQELQSTVILQCEPKYMEYIVDIVVNILSMYFGADCTSIIVGDEMAQ